MEETKHLTQEDADRIVQEALDKSEQLLNNNPFIAQLILKQLLRAVPNHPQGLQLLGLSAHRLGNHVEGAEIISMAIEVDPENAENYNNVALCYACMGEFDLAIKSLEKALEIKPGNAVFLSNLGLQLRQVGRHYQAIERFEEALKTSRTAQILTNLGGVYGELRQVEKAKACFQEATEIAPDMPAPHVDLSYAHHLLGNWDEGFKEYEWRFDFFPQLQHYKQIYDQDKKWDGQQSLEGKKILLYGEQGLGDLIMYARYIPKLKERGAKVCLHCSPALRQMFQRCDYIDETVVRDVVENKGEELPEHDYQCSTMSLPHLLGSYECSNEPYLDVLPVNNFPADQYKDTFNIGIAWAGSPAHPKDSTRSMHLKHFRDLYEMDGVKLFSFQMDRRKRVYKYVKGEVDFCEGAEDMTGIVNLPAVISNFDDTAYLLSELDLLITIDTSILHLAGALGLPAWGLIAYQPDPRWTLEGETTHWYPSIRLFRQERPNDWEGVMRKVKDELETLLSNKRQQLQQA